VIRCGKVQPARQLDVYRDDIFMLRCSKSHSKTDPNRIAAIGYCFGGATVQQLAYSSVDLRGVVSFHGSLIPPSKDANKMVKARLLICHGAADPFVTAEALQNYLAAMNQLGLDWQMVFYGGAMHSFTNPGADKRGMAALRYSPDADRRSREDMKQFFIEIFK